MWVRGLKRQFIEQNFAPQQVAPHVGAWIETANAAQTSANAKSHPMWVRGLKHLHKYQYLEEKRSRTPCGCVD